MPSTSTGQGTINAHDSLLPTSEARERYFETRTVLPAWDNNKNETYFKRAPVTIAMTTENEWPTYTFNISALPFTEVGNHYAVNMGYRHKSIINLQKSTTKMLYKTTSNQAWKCRQIVWTHADHAHFNRNTTSTGTWDYDVELELMAFAGVLKQDGDKTKIECFLMDRPVHTKYPSTPFYWAPSANIGVLYDAISVIPGKENYLDSGLHVEDTWQKLPGLVEFDDSLARGGETSKWKYGVRHQKNTYVTFIWEPDGRFSGETLPAAPGLPNKLEVDIIHTVHWNE